MHIEHQQKTTGKMFHFLPFSSFAKSTISWLGLLAFLPFPALGYSLPIHPRWAVPGLRLRITLLPSGCPPHHKLVRREVARPRWKTVGINTHILQVSIQSYQILSTNITVVLICSNVNYVRLFQLKHLSLASVGPPSVSWG